MTTQTAKQVLTPAQFVVARALAQAYGHLWSSAPDGMYDIDEIEAHYQKILDEREHFKFGITAPSLVRDPSNESFGAVVHTTESGRLTWEVGPSGSTVLEIRRPSDLSRLAAQARQTGNYTPPVNSDISRLLQEDPGILVARVKIINDDSEQFVSSILTENYDFYYETSKREESRETDSERFESAEYNPDLRDDLLFERHVGALIRPLVALMTIERPRGEEEYYEEYRESVINPAIERAKLLLAPMFAKALPDAVTLAYESDGKTLQFELPETYWSSPGDYSLDYEDGYLPKDYIAVHHHGEEFPVESEKTAVHTVLLLRQHPEMLLVDAVKSAICSKNYRPD